MVWNDQIEAFVESHVNDDVRLLALGKNPIQGEYLRTALTQIELRQKTIDKLPSFAATRGVRFPSRLSAEQCSSEICARFKQKIMPGHCKKGADLTGGMGIDTVALASLCDEMLYIEQNEELCEAARVNMPLLADNITVCHSQAEEWLDQTADEERLGFIFLDPARRDSHGGKVFRIQDCSPDVRALLPKLLKRAEKVMVKLSPMLDLKECIEALNPQSITIVSVNNECKELVAVISDTQGETLIEAVELHDDRQLSMRFTLDEEAQAESAFAESITQDMIIAEPFAGFMKSGAWKTMCARFNARMVAPSSHLYLTDSEFPGRRFRVRQVSLFNKREASRLLAGKANVAVRNFPMSVAEVKRRFGTEDGGERYIFLTTDSNGRKLIIVGEKLH